MQAVMLGIAAILLGGSLAYVGRRIWILKTRMDSLEGIRLCAAQWRRDIQVGAHPHSSLRTSIQYASLKDRALLDIAVGMSTLGAPIADVVERNDEEEKKGSECSPHVRQLLSYWALNQEYGIALGALLEKFSEDMDSMLNFYRRFQAAAAGARLTVFVLIGLPVGAVILGESMGFATLSFLFGTLIGSCVLLCGVFFLCAGVYWVENLSTRILGGVGRRAGPMILLRSARRLDIFSQALKSGVGIADSWRSSCRYEEEEITDIPALLELGAGESAWKELEDHPTVGRSAQIVIHHYQTGARLVESLEYEARRLRLEAEAQSLAASERTLVAIAAPLALCFLPAFVILGLIPIVVGIATY